jgi:hypothetical protein
MLLVPTARFFLVGWLYIIAMNQEQIRKKIVYYSKELTETTDYNQIKKLRRIIKSLKELYTPSDPKSLTDLIAGK